MIAAGALPEGARRDHGRRAGDLAGRLARCSAPATPRAPSEALDGGILAISPPADPKAMAERLSRAAAALAPGLRASTAASGRCSRRASAQARLGGDRGLRRPDRARSRPRTTASSPRSSGGGPPPRSTSPTPGCRCWSCTPRTTRSSRSSTRGCSPRPASGQRPGARLDPARRRPRRDRRRGPEWFYAVTARFLRALGRVRGRGGAGGDGRARTARGPS